MWSGCFAYSREEGTPAWSMKGRVAKKIAGQRAQKLGAIQSEFTAEQLNGYISKDLTVLVEEVIIQEGLAIARAWFNAPEVDGAVVVRFDTDDEAQVKAVQEGNVIKVRVLTCTGIDLDAHFVALVKAAPQTALKYYRQ